MRRRRPWAAAAALALGSVVAACGSDGGEEEASPATTAGRDLPRVVSPGDPPPTTAVGPPAAPPATTAPPTTARPATTGTPATTRPAAGAPPTAGPATSPPPAGPAPLAVTEVARDLDTVWALKFDSRGTLWFTERRGRIGRVGGPSTAVAGVAEAGEGGLMGLEIDARGRQYVMYTSAADNRVVRLEPDGRQTVLVDGIAKGVNHNGGRLRLGPDGSLFAATGDAGNRDLARDADGLNGKVLRLHLDRPGSRVFSRGHRNVQGLCFAADGRFFATEHGPDRGDEVNLLREGFDGGWPDTAGNGIRNYTPTIAPAGCAVYEADLIPGWRGSLLFVTLKEADLRRLTFGPDGRVTGEEVLFDERFGRLRDVAVGPDGAVYLATSAGDGRGVPEAGDDRILRVAPRGR